MTKFSNRTFRKSVLIVAAVLLGQSVILNAQQSTTHNPFGRRIQPVEVAALSSFSEMPSSTSWSSSRNEDFMASGAMPVVAFSDTEKESTPHRFWDRENRGLFVLTAGAATADFWVTHANLASGGKELNPVTRILSGSTPGLAANFALETASVIGISYFFHRTGHHTLERLTSIVNVGGSMGAVSYGLSHR